MLFSMTGYGSGQAEHEGMTVRAEVRTLNHRYLDVVVRLPQPLLPWEGLIRSRVKERLARGRAEVSVQWQASGRAVQRVAVNHGLLRGYYLALEEARKTVPIAGDADIRWLVALPNVFVPEEVDPPSEVVERLLVKALDDALAGVVAMRRREGASLYEAIRGYVDKLERLVTRIEARAPEQVEQYRRRLLERLREWAPGGGWDEQRVAAEVAFMADRCDIAEELARLKSHLRQCTELLAHGEGGGPVGRRLDFLAQEIGRELNTIGAKAQDVCVAEWIVDAKSELERLREQVQNVE